MSSGDEVAKPRVNLAERVARQVALQPAATAIIAEDSTLTYDMLWQRVEAFSALLSAAGLTRGENVAVLFGRTPDLVAAVLAVWRSGGTLVPVDPDDPSERRGHILELSNCRILFTDLRPDRNTSPHPVLRPGQTLVQAADAEAPGNSRIEPGAGIPPAISTDNDPIAYILFTSGSSGVPKGVEVTHANVNHLLDCVLDLTGGTSSDVYLATASIGFDVSYGEILLPLVSGASLVLRHRRLWLEPERIAELVRMHRITVCSTGASVWALALGKITDFPPIRVGLSSGEPMTPAVAERMPAIAEQAWNFYGPTETTIWCTGHRMAGGTPEVVRQTYNTIGRGFTGVTCRVVRTDVAGGVVDCGTGEIGELLIGGSLVARGYHQNEAETARRFVYYEGTRFYHTGDLVLLNAAGDLVSQGRLDDQMKIRGVRIEPAEIESVLASHPGILEAGVTWMDAPATGDRHVIAAWVPRPGPVASRSELVAYVAGRLPAAMVPSHWLMLDRLPKTPSLKIDRIALRAQMGSVLESASEHGTGAGWDAARSGKHASVLESKVASIWRDILGVAEILPDQSFMELGGDSFAMVRMLAGVEQQTGARISITEAFDALSLAAFVHLVEGDLEATRQRLRSAWVRPLAGPQSGGAAQRRFFFIDPDRQLIDRWCVPAELFGVYSRVAGEGYAAEDPAILVRRLIGRIRAWQPAGPYLLGGAGMGANLALEMARQLDVFGETPELVALIDPVVSGFSDSSSPHWLQAFMDARAWKRVDRLWRRALPDPDGQEVSIPKKFVVRADRHQTRLLLRSALEPLLMDTLLVETVGADSRLPLDTGRTMRLSLESGLTGLWDAKRTDKWLEVLGALMVVDRSGS